MVSIMSMRYRCLSHEFSVDADRPEDLAALSAALAPFASTGDPAVRYALSTSDAGSYSLLVDGRRVRVSGDPGEVLDLLLWYVGEHTVLAEKHFLLLHAGAVVAPDGRALLLPASSGSGKSTTTLGLVLAGFGYLSDEFAVLDPGTGLITPFPRPIALKTGTRRLLPELDGLAVHTPSDLDQTVHVPVERLGIGAAVVPAEPAWVVFPRYEAGAASVLQPMSPGETCRELLGCTFRLPERAIVALPTLAGLARVASGWRLVVGDLDEAVHLIAELTGSSTTVGTTRELAGTA